MSDQKRPDHTNTTSSKTLEFTEQKSIDLIWPQPAVAATTPLPPYVPPAASANTDAGTSSGTSSGATGDK